jgi:hypothetical protein
MEGERVGWVVSGCATIIGYPINIIDNTMRLFISALCRRLVGANTQVWYYSHPRSEAWPEVTSLTRVGVVPDRFLRQQKFNQELIAYTYRRI